MLKPKELKRDYPLMKCEYCLEEVEKKSGCQRFCIRHGKLKNHLTARKDKTDLLIFEKKCKQNKRQAT